MYPVKIPNKITHTQIRSDRPRKCGNNQNRPAPTWT